MTRTEPDTGQGPRVADLRVPASVPGQTPPPPPAPVLVAGERVGLDEQARGRHGTGGASTTTGSNSSVRSLRPVGHALTLVMIVQVVVSIVAAMMLWDRLDNVIEIPRIIQDPDVSETIQQAHWWLYLVTVLAVMAFQVRAQGNARRLWPRAMASHWVLWGWLVPLLNLVLPAVLLSQQLRAPREAAQVDDETTTWRRVVVACAIGWWGLFLVGFALEWVPVFRALNDPSPAARQSWQRSMAVGLVLEAAAAVCAIVVVRAIVVRHWAAARVAAPAEPRRPWTRPQPRPRPRSRPRARSRTGPDAASWMPPETQDHRNG